MQQLCSAGLWLDTVDRRYDTVVGKLKFLDPSKSFNSTLVAVAKFFSVATTALEYYIKLTEQHYLAKTWHNKATPAWGVLAAAAARLSATSCI